MYPCAMPDLNDPVVRAILPVGRSGLSIAAGYLGLLSLTLVVAPLALGLGIWALKDLKRRPELHGAGRAWFAVVMGTLGTAVLVLIAVNP